MTQAATTLTLAALTRLMGLGNEATNADVELRFFDACYSWSKEGGGCQRGEPVPAVEALGSSFYQTWRGAARPTRARAATLHSLADIGLSRASVCNTSIPRGLKHPLFNFDSSRGSLDFDPAQGEDRTLLARVLPPIYSRNQHLPRQPRAGCVAPMEHDRMARARVAAPRPRARRSDPSSLAISEPRTGPA